MRRGNGNVRGSEISRGQRIAEFTVGCTIAVYLAFLIGSAWTPGCNLMEWYNNFCKFVIQEHHYIVGATAMTPRLAVAFLFVWILVFLFIITAIQHPFAGREYGDAQWGNAKSFTKLYGNHDSGNEVTVNFGDCKAPASPVKVNTHNYWIADGVYINIDNKLTSNLNMLVIGPPGSGKSFRLARPILSQLAGNFLVTDPKGELASQTGQFFEDNGYEVMILAIESEEDMEHSTHFNPFRYLRCESDIMSLAQILFKATTDPDAGKGDPFFEPTAEVLLTDIIYLMYYTYPKERQNWTEFVTLLESTAVKANARGKIDNSDENCILQRFTKADRMWQDGEIDGIKHEEHLKGFVDVDKLYNGAHETTSSVVASLDAHCRYMKLDCVKKLLSEDDIQIKKTFGYCEKTPESPTGKRILFIKTSEDKRYFDWITSMVYSLFFDELYHLTGTDPDLHGTLPEHLTFLMDEFSNVTLPPSFVEKLSTMRSRGMSAVIIIQNLHQLKQKFPENDMDLNLRANCSITSVLAGPDVNDAEELEKLFGKTTIHKQTQGTSTGGQGSLSTNEDVMEYPLLSAQKMHEMSKDGPCAISITGTDPLYEQKVRFELEPLLPLLTRRNPYRIRDKKIITQSMIDHTKSYFDQLPDICFGAEAEAFAEKCKSEGIRVLTLTENDVDAYINVMDNKKEALGRDASTKTFWENVHLNSKIIDEDKQNGRVDFAEYTNMQSLVVQKMLNTGYNAHQINALKDLIKADLTSEEINEFFNPSFSIAEIRSFAPRLLSIRNEKQS